MGRMFWKPVDRQKLVDIMRDQHGRSPGLRRELAKADEFLRAYPDGTVKYFIGLKNNSAIAVCRKRPDAEAQG